MEAGVMAGVMLIRGINTILGQVLPILVGKSESRKIMLNIDCCLAHILWDHTVFYVSTKDDRQGPSTLTPESINRLSEYNYDPLSSKSINRLETLPLMHYGKLSSALDRCESKKEDIPRQFSFWCSSIVKHVNVRAF
jgi:hypothetical protein